MKGRFKSLRKLRLSDEERQDIRDRLILGLNFSVRKSEAGRHYTQWPLTVLFLNHKSMFVSIVVAVALVLSGATGVAAENALPGDALYSFKTQVNERVRSAFAVGADHEAELQAGLAGHRLREAALLAAKGELSKDLRARMAERFEHHVRKTKQLIERLEAQGNNEAAARLEATLEAQIEANAALLDKLENGSKADVKELKERVEALRVDLRVMKERAHAELKAKLDTKPQAEQAAQVRQDVVGKQIEKIKEFLNNAEASADVSADVLAKAKADIADAEKFYAEGKSAAGEGTFVEAIRNFNQAHKEAVEAKVFIKAGDPVFKARDERRRKMMEQGFEKQKENRPSEDSNSTSTENI